MKIVELFWVPDRLIGCPPIRQALGVVKGDAELFKLCFLLRDSSEHEPLQIAGLAMLRVSLISVELDVAVVTTPNEPKIPFVAQALGVQTVDFWKFLDLEHFKARSCG